MAITKVFSERPRTGWKFDARQGKYFSFKIDVYFGGRRIREKGFQTRREAEAVIAKLKLLEKEEKFDLPNSKTSPPLALLFEKRIADAAERSKKELTTRVLNYFLAMLPEGIRVSEVTVSHLQEFVARRRVEKTKRGTIVKIQTVDRELTVIAAALHSAAAYFPELEDWVPPRIPHPKISRARRERVITDAEKEKILHWLLSDRRDGEKFHAVAARHRVGQIFLTAMMTGMRHSEIMRLRWSDYDEKAKSLRVHRSKTDSISHISPLPESVREIFRARRNVDERGEFIFTRSGATPPNFYRILKDACAARGISYGRFTPGGIILHDARHTFTTRLQQAGVDLATIQSFTGHSDKELVLRYSHARPESRRRAMRAIETEPEKFDSEELKKVFEAVKNGEMNFKEFARFIERLGTK